jgi:hypothetical protein
MIIAISICIAGFAVAFIGLGITVMSLRKAPPAPQLPRQTTSQPRDADGRYASPKPSMADRLRADVEASRKAKS